MVAINSSTLNAPLDLSSFTNRIALEQQQQQDAMRQAIGSLLGTQTTPYIAPNSVADLQGMLVENKMMTQPQMDTGVGIYGNKTRTALDNFIAQQQIEPVIQPTTQVTPQATTQVTTQPTEQDATQTQTQPNDFWGAVQQAMGRFADQNLYSQNESGQTSMLQDIIRSQAAVYAPQYSAILESGIKSKADQALLDKKTTLEAQKKLLDEKTKNEYAINKDLFLKAVDVGDTKTIERLAPLLNITGTDLSGLAKDDSSKATVSRYIDPVTKKEFNGYGTTNGIMNSDTGKVIPNAVEKEKPKTPKDQPSAIELAKLVTGFRKEFEALPRVKDANEIFGAVNKMEKAYSDYTANPDKYESKNALDQALIIVFNKMLDPGSVVRESEYARTPQGISLINRANGFLEKLSKGGSGITDQDRLDIVNVGRLLEDGAKEIYNKSSDIYSNEAKLLGVDPSRIISPVPVRKIETQKQEDTFVGTKEGFNVYKKPDGTLYKKKV